MFFNIDGTVRKQCELTLSQIAYEGWLAYYSWILSGEGPPPPSDDILNDDESLDDYVRAWKRSLKEKNNKDKQRANREAIARQAISKLKE